MRIILDRALFAAQSGAEAIALLNLLVTAASDLRKHALLTAPLYVPGGDNGEIDAWLSARPSSEADAFRALLVNGIQVAAAARSQPASDVAQPRRWHLPGQLEIRVERRTESDWAGRILTIVDAVALLKEPVHLVVESSRTEPAFLRHLAGPTDGALLRTLIAQPGRIEIHNGGGGHIKTWIEALAGGGTTPEKWRRMLRVWILFDRDSGDYDAHKPSSTAVKIMNACEDVVSLHGIGLSWICLGRRELESYIPDAGLVRESHQDHATFVQQVIAWRASPLHVRDAWALDLKNGLCGDLRAKLPQADREAVNNTRTLALAAHMLKFPFSQLAPADVSLLAKGLGELLGKALRADADPAWAGDVPAEYDRGPADQVSRGLLVTSLFDRM